MTSSRSELRQHLHLLFFNPEGRMYLAGNSAAMKPLANSSNSYITATFKKSIGISSSFSLVAAAGSMQICCCSGSNSNPKQRGFGSSSKPKKPSKKEKQADKNTPSVISPEAPLLRSQIDGNSNSFSIDNQFDEKLQAVKRLALQKKQEEKAKDYTIIDYDAPTETKSGTVGMAAKIGAGVAVVLFGIVFAFGDLIPSGSVSPIEESTKEDTRISSEERANLKMRLQQFEEALSTNPEDPVALEGSAVTLTELGEYNRAASLLENLSKKKASDPDVFRLLGEVKYQLKDYEGSASAYRMSALVSKSPDFEVLRGLTNALLAAKRPDEAVQVLLASRTCLEKDNRITSYSGAESNPLVENSVVDPIQLDLLLGKAYSDWGHVSDAVSVYDQIISNHPDDFRGYLAKGIILRENGNSGDAQRMFIQARFFAPEKAKALVDRYSR